jgi:hypothetical protein
MPARRAAVELHGAEVAEVADVADLALPYLREQRAGHRAQVGLDLADALLERHDGEPIPGVEVSTSDPKLVVKTAVDAGDVLAQAFADGLLSLDDLTAPAAIEAAS